MAQIRHIAISSDGTEKLADFYIEILSIYRCTDRGLMLAES